ncbi:unnamed protein product [Caenorhabditis brenneri]
MEKLVKMVKWHIDSMQYVCHLRQTIIVLRSANRDYSGSFIIEAVYEFNENSEIFKDEISGWQYGFSKHQSIDQDEDSTSVQVLGETQRFSRMIFHNLIRNLFQTQPALEVNVYPNFELSELFIFEGMKNFRLCGDANHDTNANYAEAYFSKARNLNCAVVSTPITPVLNSRSKLTTAKYLYFENTSDNAKTLPLHFNGHRAIFHRCKCDRRTLVAIIQRWLTNKGFQNLHALEINSYGTLPYRFGQNLPEIDARPWDRLRRPENFENDYRAMGYHFKPFKCANFLDVVRESDGKVASFHITQTTFKFCVWN